MTSFHPMGTPLKHNTNYIMKTHVSIRMGPTLHAPSNCIERGMYNILLYCVLVVTIDASLFHLGCFFEEVAHKDLAAVARMYMCGRPEWIFQSLQVSCTSKYC